jgi:hypothetical protein
MGTEVLYEVATSIFRVEGTTEAADSLSAIFTLKMEAVVVFETLISIYRSPRVASQKTAILDAICQSLPCQLAVRTSEFADCPATE